MPIPIYQVDAFTRVPFKGNPAGVCLLDQPESVEWMQAMAAEMNLSETAFLLPEGDLEEDSCQNCYRLRWFTPKVEVKLCGHATLASAHILWQTGLLPSSETARFLTRSGELTARKRGDWIELNFPARPAAEAQAPEGMIESLGVEPLFVGKANEDYLVEVASEAEVRRAAPDFAALKSAQARGIILTSKADSVQLDFVSRFFAPAVGINEDPVTGSSHTTLVPYWSHKLGKTEMAAHQASARGGDLRLRLEGERVIIGGQAVTIFSGQIPA